MNPKRIAGALVVISGLVAILFWAAIPDTWAKEPTEFLGINLGQPISASLPTCKSPDDVEECFEPQTSTVNNASDSYGMVYVDLQGGVVKEVTVMISVLNADIAYNDLVERYGKPNGSIFDSEPSWNGKHVSITMSRPTDKDNPGTITIDDADVKFDRPLEHHNPF